LLAATPYALKVPVDGSTIGWNAQGELELLKEASVTKIGGQKIVATGASSGQVLAWDSSSKEWKPTTVASASSTIAKDGNSGAGGLTLGTNDAEPLTLETNNNPAVTVTSAGNVGIGTTAPASKLTVTSNTDNNLALETYEGTYNGAALRFYKAKGTAAIPAQATNGNDLGRMTFSGHSGTSFKTAANIAVLADGNITETSSPGRIEFLTTPTASTAPTVRMTVKNDGNVGIGTTTPTAALEVNGGVRLATATAKPTCDSTKRGTIWVEQGGVGVTDTAYLCMKAAADTYSWISVTTGG